MERCLSCSQASTSYQRPCGKVGSRNRVSCAAVIPPLGHYGGGQQLRPSRADSESTHPTALFQRLISGAAQGGDTALERAVNSDDQTQVTPLITSS